MNFPLWDTTTLRRYIHLWIATVSLGRCSLSILKGPVKKMGEMGKLEHLICDFCNKNERCCEEIEHVARPFPDKESDGKHYLPLSKTPAKNRDTDDYMPRVQLKAAYASGQCCLDDPTSIYIFQKVCCGREMREKLSGALDIVES